MDETPLTRVFGRLDQNLLRLLKALNDTLDQVADPALRGLIISGLEVERLLAITPGARPDDSSLAGSLWDEVDAWRSAQPADSLPTPIELLRARFGLSVFECECVLVCLSAEIDRKYERIFGYLNDDVTRRLPTVHLLLKLLTPNETNILAARSLITSGGRLLRYGILAWADEDATAAGFPELTRCLRVEPGLVPQLFASGMQNPRLVAMRAPASYPPEAAAVWNDDGVRNRLESALSGFLGRRLTRGRALVIVVAGPPGSGRLHSARLACKRMGLGLLPVEVARLPGGSPTQPDLAHVFRDALLTGSVPCVVDGEALAKSDGAVAPLCREVEMLLAATCWILIVCAESPTVLRDRFRRHHRVEVHLDVPERRRAAAAWHRLMAQHGSPPEEPELLAQDLAVTYSLTPGQMSIAYQQASAAIAIDAGDLSWRDALHAAARMVSAPCMGHFAERIETNRGRAELILSDDRHDLLADIVRRVRHRATVLEDWGFDAMLNRGKGLNILFSGLPGTGKTMAAEVIARELALDLYRIDLATVVSKYIGESEKNLSRIFTEARRSNAILFFDEADALFGKRTEVHDAHDRYANIEVNYLLQQMENYSGVTILATNLRKNLDEAFLRRIQVSVDFPLPDREQRLRIWNGAFPTKTPRDEDVDLPFLADTFELSGGSISNIAVTAAFLAADTGCSITMRDLVQATRRELTKLGKRVIPSEFGPYQELLDGALTDSAELRAANPGG